MAKAKKVTLEGALETTTATEPEQVPVLTLTLDKVKTLYSLYNKIVKADNVYHRCQSELFWQYVVNNSRAPGVVNAFAELKAFIDENGGAD